MGKINVLDKDTINQIAAGEVIERPASVVKELMENAIDALATAITVEIKDGGVSFIRITDNGAGIAKEDVKTAFLRHATSKIKSAIDLVTVSSLGFRGEALSSISAVSMVELITKRREDFFGTRYEINGGSEGNIEEIGVPDGTTFIVRNLFYNTPARRKFLKSAATEGSYIHEIVTRMAMSRPDISIRFINNGKTVLHTSGNGNLKDVIYTIYGREIASNLIPVESEDEHIKISGFIGKPLICRGNRTYENYFINERYIKSNIINKAIEEGFRNFMMQHKYPFTALHFGVNQEMLDVNVHPTKMELRFRNSEEIYPIVIRSIQGALQQKDLTRETVFASEKEIQKKITEEIKEVNNKPAPEPFEVNRIKQMMAEENNSYMPKLSQTKTREVSASNQKNVEDIKPEVNKNIENIKPVERTVERPADNPAQMDLFDGKLLSKEARVNHKIIGQVFDTYWIVQYGDKMFIIDQHAAHEKVLYERTINRLKERKTMSQTLNPPIILTLTPREIQVINQYMDYFHDLGYEIEEFGGNEYAVRAVPFDLFSVAKKDLLIEIIDDLSDDASIKKQSELLLDRVATMSCKAAVKGNNKLSFAEAGALIDELMTLDNPYNCPHGRPTIISMSKYELEKKFKRIV